MTVFNNGIVQMNLKYKMLFKVKNLKEKKNPKRYLLCLQLKKTCPNKIPVYTELIKS